MQLLVVLLVGSLCRLLPIAAGASCNNDNCLRAMSASPNPASAFCHTYTTQVLVATTGLPTFLSRCSSSPSKISSACSCIAPAIRSVTNPTIPTSVPRTPTSPANSCAMTITQYATSTVTSYITNVVAATAIVTSYVTSTVTNSVEITVADDFTSTETDFLTATVASTATAALTSYLTNTVIISVTVTISDDFTSIETDSLTATITKSIAESVTYSETATVTDSFTATIFNTATVSSCLTTITATATVTALPSCAPGSTFCQGVCLDVSMDPNNCGLCGNICSSLPNSVPACSSGTCGYVCNPGFKDCDSNTANGCEVSVLNDRQNCGNCAAACLNPINFETQGNFQPFVSSCTSGVCSYQCIQGQTANCAGPDQHGNPCPIYLQFDSSNCGACGNTCQSRPNAESGFCTNGNCYSPCSQGFTDCDGNFANGCETYTNGDVSNCGACGNVCFSAPNGVTTCASGTCNFQCSSGFADCDANLGNGCEVNILTDRNNCGRCGHGCNILQHCSGGSCVT